MMLDALPLSGVPRSRYSTTVPKNPKERTAYYKALIANYHTSTLTPAYHKYQREQTPEARKAWEDASGFLGEIYAEKHEAEAEAKQRARERMQ